MTSPNSRKLAVAIAYVVLSSLTGLLFLIGSEATVVEGWEHLTVYGMMWSRSIAADIVFTIGILLTGLLAYRLAKRERPLLSLATGAVGTWIVYTLSAMLAFHGDPRIFPVGADFSDVVEIAGFTAAFGFAGIVFGALAPLLAWRNWGDWIEGERAYAVGATEEEEPV